MSENCMAHKWDIIDINVFDRSQLNSGATNFSRCQIVLIVGSNVNILYETLNKQVPNYKEISVYWRMWMEISDNPAKTKTSLKKIESFNIYRYSQNFLFKETIE